MEAAAQDDALELLEALLRDLFNEAVQTDKRNRQRTIKDLDRAAELLANACRMVLDEKLPDVDVRDNIFNIIIIHIQFSILNILLLISYTLSRTQ